MTILLINNKLYEDIRDEQGNFVTLEEVPCWRLAGRAIRNVYKDEDKQILTFEVL